MRYIHGCALFCLALCLSPVISAQGTNENVGEIDGSKTPELIPDDTAYKLWFIAVAEPENPTAEQRNRALAKIRASGLGDNDIAVVMRVLASFYKEHLAIDAKLRALSQSAAGDNAGALADLDAQVASAVSKAKGSLYSELSLTGQDVFRAHIARIKQKIKIVRF